MFCLLSSYYGVWFVIGLLQHDVVRRFVAMLYLYGGNLNKQNGFNQSKISNYGR